MRKRNKKSLFRQFSQLRQKPIILIGWGGISMKGYPVVSKPRSVTDSPCKYYEYTNNNCDSGSVLLVGTNRPWYTSRTRSGGKSLDNDFGRERWLPRLGFIPWILEGKPTQRVVTSMFGFVVNLTPRPSPLDVRWGRGKVLLRGVRLRAALVPRWLWADILMLGPTSAVMMRLGLMLRSQRPTSIPVESWPIPQQTTRG